MNIKAVPPPAPRPYHTLVTAGLVGMLLLLPGIKESIDPGNKILAVLFCGIVAMFLFLERDMLSEIGSLFSGRAGEKARSIRLLVLGLLGFFVLRLLLQSITEFGLKETVIKLAFQLTFIASFFIYAYNCVRRGYGVAAAIGLLIGVLVAVNLLGVKLGYTSTLEEELYSLGSHLSYTGTGVRFQVPFWTSSGAFYPVAGMGVCFSLFGLLQKQRVVIRLFLMLSLLSSAIVLWKGESFSVISGTLGAVLVIVPFWLAKGRGKKVLAVCALLLSAVVAVGSYNQYLEKAMEKIVPDWLFELNPRAAEALYTMNGRSIIYEYGMEQLIQGKAGVFGQGPIKRDASMAVAAVDKNVLRQRIGYHNGALEIVMALGVLYYLFFVFLHVRFINVVGVLDQANRRWLNTAYTDVCYLIAVVWLCSILTNAIGTFDGLVISMVAPLAIVMNLDRNRMISSGSRPRSARANGPVKV